MTGNTTSFMRDVYIVDGARTPFLKAKGKPGPFSAADLAVSAGKELLGRQPFSPEEIDEVVIGCVMPNTDEANIGRVVSLRLGCGKSVPAWTVQRNCASGMQSLDSAAKDIATGRHDLVLAGGTEAMSRAPLLYNDNMTNWFAGLASAKGWNAKLKQWTQLKPGNLFNPVVALLKGLTDPLVNLSMGQTAENLAYRFNITREQMDQFSFESHHLTAAAQDEHVFQNEVINTFANSGDFYVSDDGVRRDSSMEKLGALKPFFDKKFGSVTPGNSSQVSDGATLMLLASKEAIKKYQLPVLARIVNVEWAGVEPAEMGLGPVYAVNNLLQRYNLAMDDIDFWEINEAFAAQVLGCLAAWESDDYCRRYLGLDRALGKLDRSKLNIDGGAIAVGHPVGASGARIVLHLAQVLRRKNAKKGIATICIGGGQGGAVLIENVSEV
ncbi:acetyl-CoA C-acetyltransferase [Aquicella lusitana]|uniref:3-ketoacyl-CoA thiolase n=1 Tax=Aquicella lusitana TaxID=254246 RepID=A0A370GRB1_9COXI|nr:acetyl-CoA C-acetyltransferase [Aquicella lusitana]RDI46051.1 3-ketoacyl-CoA thiolase [Aquicella lusitana]VVC73352.1 Acetyl-CoA acetyltransferase [Aquicella lusitana]